MTRVLLETCARADQHGVGIAWVSAWASCDLCVWGVIRLTPTLGPSARRRFTPMSRLFHTRTLAPLAFALLLLVLSAGSALALPTGPCTPPMS